MRPYRYKPLKDPDRDIRLITLLPGGYGDEIQIHLDHVPLVAPTILTGPERPTLEQIRQTLPSGWDAHELLENTLFDLPGRIVFADPDENTQWTHPDPSVDNEVFGVPKLIFNLWYEALSYTWGTEENQEYIKVVPRLPRSLCQKKRGIKIRANLASAFRCLRYKTVPRTLYVDAICINQDDLEERGAQVRRMPEIYKFSPRVIAWLGDSSTHSTHAMDMLRHQGGQFLRSALLVPVFNPDGPEPRRPWGEHLPYDSHFGAGFEDILNREYFKRLWIWQEIVLGDDRTVFQCGPDQIEWHVLAVALSSAFGAGSNMPHRMKEAYRHAYNLVFADASCSFREYMDLTSGQQCENQRDRVYAVLGMTETRFRKKINIDYSLPISTVYANAMLSNFRADGNLRILEQCDFSSKLADGPSWVPNWSARGHKTLLPLFLATPSDRRVTPEHRPPDRLLVRGVTCGSIATVTQCFDGSKGRVHLFDQLRSEVPSILGRDDTPGRASRLEALVRILCLNQLEEADHELTATVLSSLSDARKAFEECFVTGNNGMQNVDSGGNDIDYLKRVVKSINGRVLLETYEGHVGSAPCGAQPGDIVCLIFGCHVPMLLRQDSNYCFQVVGPLYVHGLMYSEGILGPIPPPWREKSARRGAVVLIFKNDETGETTYEDPRLGLLPPEWTLVQEICDEKPWREWYNSLTEEYTDGDPRTTIDALKARGVGVEELTLI